MEFLLEAYLDEMFPRQASLVCTTLSANTGNILALLFNAAVPHESGQSGYALGFWRRTSRKIPFYGTYRRRYVGVSFFYVLYG